MKVLLVDDHVLFAKSLETVFEDVDVITEFACLNNVENIEEFISKYRPDIILMDINLGKNEEDGLTLAQKILCLFPELYIIILSGYDLPVYRHEARRLGARGFINKNVDPQELTEILIIVKKGNLYFREEQVTVEELTHTEKEVLTLISKGVKRKDIALQLYLSERTVSNHLQHIFEKLQVSSAVEAVTKAITMGYLSPLC